MNATEWALSLVKTIRNEPPSDGELVDTIADLKAAADTLNECRRMLMSEVSGPLAGTMHQITEGRKATRSYNDSGLLYAFWRGDVNSTLHYLMAEGVVGLNWKWTPLRALAAKDDVSLRIAQHEISDGDEEHIGEVWQSDLRVEAK